MKVRICWLTLLLVGSSIISVSPENSSTLITTLRSIKPIYTSTSTQIKMNRSQELIYSTPSMRMTSSSSSEYSNRSNFKTKLYNNVMMLKNAPLTKKSVGRNVRNAAKNPETDLEKERRQEQMTQRCQQFLIGEADNNKFFSPNHPADYTSNTNCTRVLQAPPDHYVRLDFRDSFNIEPSEDCKYDFLEIRDGQYGFSNLIGKYCGTDYPPMVISKDRHLWLSFHSDENIEYSGFTAVFEYVQKPIQSVTATINCTKHVSGYEGIISRNDIPPETEQFAKENNLPLDCLWIVTVEKGWKIQLSFLLFKLQQPNECEKNFIDTFGELPDIPSRLEIFCGSIADSAISLSNVLHVRFYAEQDSLTSNFSILFTAFRDQDKGSSDRGCEENEYDCEDSTCIAGDLKCNGNSNCRFGWDEDECHTQETEQSEHVVIIIIVFGLILGGMMATFLFNCTRKLIRDQKIIRDHIRQSKESKLDEMGRSSSKRSQENLSIKLSPREKHSQSSIQILDDVSNRYYREVVPISIETNGSDLRKDSIMKQKHDIVIQTSIGDDTLNSEPGTCETGCQTRESLFQPLTRQKSSTTPPNQHQMTEIRFSTFGYDAPPSHQQSSKTLPKQSTNKSNRPRMQASAKIEMEDLSRPDPLAPRPYEPTCHHHHQHQQHLQQQQQQQPHHHHPHHPTMVDTQQPPPQTTTAPTPNPKTKQKIDESKVFIDVRNSAPDVIIMTSH